MQKIDKSIGTSIITLPLLNTVKTRTFIQYIILKKFKFSTILSASQPTCHKTQ